MARQLRQAGWPKARALVGGWRAWVDAGRPLELKPREGELVSIERAGDTT